MNDENKVLEWIPDVEEYNPNISKEKWLELIGNRSVFDENALIAFACIKNANVATCSDMAEEFGRVKNFYNNNVWQTGKKVHLETNCQLSERDNEEDRYWSVCCLGRYLVNGRFEYKIRPELEEAFEENGVLKKVNLYKEMVDKEKEFREWMAVQIIKKGEHYTDNTTNSYCRALKNRPKDLNIEDKYKRSIFSYDDYWSYEDIMKKIQNAPNFNVIKNKSGRGTFSAAMNLYKDFLKNNIEKYSINQNIMNKENNDNKGNNNKIQKYIDILEANKNLILTGAPGTGKTFLAKQIAARIIYGDNVPEKFENDIAYETQCKLVQFHPSYDYTDFVEGLRPVEKDGNIGFERKDGVFKEFCKRAIRLRTADNIQHHSDNGSHKTTDNSQRVSDDEINNAIETFKVDLKSKDSIELKSFRSNDVFTFSLTKKETICVKNNKDHSMSNKKILKYISEGSYAPNDTYTPTIGNYIKDNYLIKKTDNSITSLNNNSPKKNFVFIIDEINRGEISKIFGELFYCIDPGYRGKKGCISTQYQNLVPKDDVFYEKGFYVPENVYIIGTMNDIDRSVESMDFAFRRRFAFMEVKADENLEMLYEELDKELAEKSKNRLINLNKKISEMEDEGLSSAYHIGASYFLKIKDYNGDFEKLWDYHLNGLLREYLRGMPNIEAKIKSLKVAYDNESASNN